MKTASKISKIVVSVILTSILLSISPSSVLATPLSAKPAAISDLTITRSGSDMVLDWSDVTLDTEGEVGYRARKSKRLADVIIEQTSLPIRMWDESGTTKAAIDSRIKMGVSRKKRKGHLDDVAASILLQDFLIHNKDLDDKEQESLE